MPSVTIDLPADLLDVVSRLAEAQNVPRADIYRLAVASYARFLELERELDGARESRGEALRARDLEQRASRSARALVISLSQQVDDTSRERDLAVRTARTTALEYRRLAAELDVAREAATESRRRREVAEARALELEERDRQKVLAVLRDQEVATLRRRHQELAVTVQKLEQDLVYQRMDAGMKDKKLAGLERQLEAMTKQKGEFETGFKREQKETFKGERQIGRLMQERAKLRDELKRLAGLINRAPGAAAPARAARVQSKS
jgi:chromosome segregation ATPase